MKPDPLVDEVREARREISRECHHDLRNLFARYQILQDQMKAEGNLRFVSIPLIGGATETSLTPMK